MITGFSQKINNGQWYADYKTETKWTFKKIWKNNLGYFIKVGKKEVYFTKEQTNDFENYLSE